MSTEFNDTTLDNAVAGPGPTIPNALLSNTQHCAVGRYRRRFLAGHHLIMENEECSAVLYVLEGWLALSKSLSDGRTQIVDFALPGEMVDPAGADGVTTAVTVQAITQGAAAVVPGTTWRRMLHGSPDLECLANHHEAARCARRGERMLRLGKATAEMRVAYALLELCIRVGSVIDKAGPDFHIPVTQQQIGDFIGLSSVHVCRTMRRMARNGILLATDHMQIHVLDLVALTRIAGADWHDLKREILPGSSVRQACA